MPVNVIEQRFRNQLTNGEDFTQYTGTYTDYLNAAIGEKQKVRTTIEVFWNTQAVANFQEIVFGTNYLKRSFGNWQDDEFSNGDTITIANSSNNGSYTISYIADDYMYITTTFGTPETSTTATIHGTTALDAIIFGYGLIDNDAVFSINSLVDNNTQQYSVDNLRPSGLITANPLGAFQSWRISDEECKMEYDSTTNYRQKFYIYHEFYVQPFYLNGQLSDLENNIAPDYLHDNASLKYVTKWDVRKTMADPNKTHIGQHDSTLGSVGWYNENFNGFMPVRYAVTDITYTRDSVEVDEISVLGNTSVEIDLRSFGLKFSDTNTKLVVNCIYLPSDDSEYINTSTTLDENYVFDTKLITLGSGTDTGINGIMTNITSTFTDTEYSKINFDISYTEDQRAIIESGYYLIWITTQDYTLTDNDRVAAKINPTEFSTSFDNATLMNWLDVGIFEHPFTPSANPTMAKTNFRGWVEDGIYIEGKLRTNAALLNSLSFKAASYNSVTGEKFDMVEHNFDFSTNPIVDTYIRQLSVEDTRGFKLKSGDIYNDIDITLGANVGNNQEYDFKFGMKLRWEDWIKLNINFGEFYSAAEANNGFNQKWSNYFTGNWQPRITIEAAVEDINGLQTIFENISYLDVYDYDLDENPTPLWSGIIETYKGAQSLTQGGRVHYSTTEDTFIRAVFTTTDTITASIADMYGVVRIEEYQAGSLTGIYEISSEVLPLANNLLKPLTGETKLKKTLIDTHNVKFECDLDFTKIDPDKEYKISSRLGNNVSGTVVCAWETIISGGAFRKVKMLNKENGYSITEGGTFYRKDAGVWNNVSNVRTGISTVTGFDMFDNIGFASPTISPDGNNTIYKTDDFGDNWRLVYNDAIFGNVQAIFCLDTSNIWAAGIYGQMYRSIDGGENWTIETMPAIDYVHAVFMFSTTSGFAVGNNGKLFIYDGTWKLTPSGTTEHLKDIFFIDANTGWIVGFNGTILKSTNGGGSWLPLTSGTTADLLAVDFLNENYGFAVSNTNVLKSINGGTSWTIDTTASGDDVSVVDENYIYVTPSSLIRYSCKVFGCMQIDDVPDFMITEGDDCMMSENDLLMRME